MRLSIKTIKAYILLTFTAAICTSQAGAQETGFSYVERELNYLMAIWPGDYDNQEQVTLDARARDIDENNLPRFHTYVGIAEIPALGDHVIYMEKHEDSDPGKIYQQNIYVLSADEEQRAVRATAYALREGLEFTRPYGHDKTAIKLGEKDLQKLDGCDFLIRRDGYEFSGAMQPGSCIDHSAKGFLEQSIRLSETEFSFQERRVDSSGNLLSSIADFQPRNMRKARWFACMVDVPRDRPGVPNHTQHYIKIHDQGGNFEFTHPDGRKLNFLMRNTWSYGMQRDTFVIVVQDEDGRTLVYSWGEPGADRIGVNPGYVRIQCDLDTENMVRLQHGLRAES